MEFKQISILISFLLGIFCIRLIRKNDIYEKEPFFKLFLVTLWGGLFSVIIAFVFYFSRQAVTDISHLQTFYGAFFVIGPAEELAKVLAFFFSFFIFRKELNEPIDGIIYMSCVALGFSLIENYMYANRAAGQEYLLFLRIVTATPMHISFSAPCGLAFYLIEKHKKPPTVMAFALIYASFMHGLYDYLIFAGLAGVILIVIMYFYYRQLRILLNYAVLKSPFRKTLAGFINNYSMPKKKKGITCEFCGSINDKETYRFGKCLFQKCDICKHYVIKKRDLFQLFKFFAPESKNPGKAYMQHQGRKPLFSLYGGNWVNDETKRGYFDLKELNGLLEEIRSKSIRNFESNWIVKKFLLPYMN
jgi:RsiW-degrading membrane proteinase PrsW (M82 family)